jgi:hypothetical protein
LAFSTHKVLLLSLIFFVIIFTGIRVQGQEVTVHGTIFNMYRTKPLEAVSVQSTTGRGTTTDSNGNYVIVLTLKDSLWFSYLGRSTARFAVSAINYSSGFDIALHVDPVTLKEVRVMPRDYRVDSLQNRQDYAKIFNYRKPGVRLSSTGAPVDGPTAGFDLDQLIEIFQFQKKREMLAFQHRLVDEEHDKFVDHRFSRSVVLKITHLEGDELDSFMVRYRPSYDFCKRATDYDLLDYIKLAFKEYQKDRKDRP